MKPTVEAFFDEATNTVSYVVSDPQHQKAVIIDPVLDFDEKSGRTATTSADKLIGYVKTKGFNVDWILETHAHADHLSAAPYLKENLGGKIAIGARITEVQSVFCSVFNLEQTFKTDGSQFDVLLSDNQTFYLGDIPCRVLHTPGHTPACVTYVIGDAAFVGDTLFMPDFGTARTDFPGGDAATLYQSIQKILSLPAGTRLFMCHDYKSAQRDEYAWETTIEQQKQKNIHLGGGVSESDYVEMREARDAKLAMPRLLLPSIQVNIRAGNFPPTEDNGVSYLKLPLNAL